MPVQRQTTDHCITRFSSCGSEGGKNVAVKETINQFIDEPEICRMILYADTHDFDKTSQSLHVCNYRLGPHRTYLVSKKWSNRKQMRER